MAWHISRLSTGGRKNKSSRELVGSFAIWQQCERKGHSISIEVNDLLEGGGFGGSAAGERCLKAGDVSPKGCHKADIA